MNDLELGVFNGYGTTVTYSLVRVQKVELNDFIREVQERLLGYAKPRPSYDSQRCQYILSSSSVHELPYE